MSPSSGGGIVLRHPAQLKPDKVYSYLSDDGSMDEFPKRAYSVGSKPISVRAKDQRVPGYMDMTGKQGLPEKANPKSCSAPHLSDKEKSRSQPHIAETTPMKRGGKIRQMDLNDLFMELDFVKAKKDSELQGFRPRASSGGRDLRIQTSTFGQESSMRHRASSFGKEGQGVSRTGSMNRQEITTRPRTSTICQDSFRSRTSSFGTNDMRPRSSSFGNARFRRGRSSQEGSRHSSQESLRRVSAQRASQESLKSHKSNEYLDIMTKMANMSPAQILNANLRALTAEKVGSPAKALPQDSGYMTMEPEGSDTKTKSSSIDKMHKKTKGSGKSSNELHLKMPNKDMGSGCKSAPARVIGSSDKLSPRRNGMSDTPKVYTTKNSAGSISSSHDYIDIEIESRPGNKSPSKLSVYSDSKNSELASSSSRKSSPQLVHTPVQPIEDSYAIFTPGADSEIEDTKQPESVQCPIRITEELDNSVSKADGASSSTSTSSLANPQQKPHEYVNVDLRSQDQSKCQSLSPCRSGSGPGSATSGNDNGRLSPASPSQQGGSCSSGSDGRLSPLLPSHQGGGGSSGGDGRHSPSIGRSPSPVRVRSISPFGLNTGGSLASSSGRRSSSPHSGRSESPKPVNKSPSPLPARCSPLTVKKIGTRSASPQPSSKRQGTPPPLPAMPSRRSAPSLPAMDRAHTHLTDSPSGDRRSYHETGNINYENVALGAASQVSTSSDRELNYASLDLTSSTEDFSTGERCPKPPHIIKTQPPANEDAEPPLSYAEIDFTKSEGLRTASNTLRENRLSFELK